MALYNKRGEYHITLTADAGKGFVHLFHPQSIGIGGDWKGFDPLQVKILLDPLQSTWIEDKRTGPAYLSERAGFQCRPSSTLSISFRACIGVSFIYFSQEKQATNLIDASSPELLLASIDQPAWASSIDHVFVVGLEVMSKTKRTKTRLHCGHGSVKRLEEAA